ncbi:hypothetical protein F4802DRAFT_609670 [Xylaria palmicola]|nr:hypothetical protein F4802DRAFT_609670 [Xylaria palmicola]
MNCSLDGHGLSQAQRQAKAEAAAFAGETDANSPHQRDAHSRPPAQDDTCEWQGDAPDPELDDLAAECDANRQPSRPVDTCDWRGDGPEQQQDDLSPICPPPQQVLQSDRSHEPVKEPDSVQTPTLPPSERAGPPAILVPSADDKDPAQKHDAVPSLDRPARDGKPFELGKRPRKNKPHAGNAAGPSIAPTRDKTHSPWVDSLEQMSATVMEKVNIGVKQTLEAATSRLGPAAHDEPQPKEPAVTGKSRRNSSLAPASAAAPLPEFYVPRPAQTSTDQPEDDDLGVNSKRHQRERSRSEKKARREARRRARQEKTKERRAKRKEEKERHRKEREWKKIARKGKELPPHLRQGLRPAPGLKVPYHPECDICTRAAASAMSSKKRDPSCTTCGMTAERESTNQYLESAKLDLGELPTWEDILNSIKKFLGKEKNSATEPRQGGAHVDEELAKHIALHVQDFTANGGEPSLRGHKCNKKGRSGHPGRHGLDGNRDSPTTTDRDNSTSNSDASTAPALSEVDWWVRAVSSTQSPYSPYCPDLPPLAITPLPR